MRTGLISLGHFAAAHTGLIGLISTNEKSIPNHMINKDDKKKLAHLFHFMESVPETSTAETYF